MQPVLATNFFLNGFARLDLPTSDEHKALVDMVQTLDTLKLESSELFRESYRQTFDLIKCDDYYTNTVIDFVLQSELLTRVQQATGGQYALGDFALRKTYAKRSYMNWHRDTFIDFNGTLVGRVPPLIKIIFYPQTGPEIVPCLQVLPGSHRRVLRTKILDRYQHLFTPSEMFASSNDAAIMFDSSIIHSAAASARDNGDFRLIFNFCHKDQVSDFSKGAIVQQILSGKQQATD